MPIYIYVLIIPYSQQLLPSDSFPFQIHLKKKHSNLQLSVSVKHKRRRKIEKKKWQDLTPTRSRMHRANFILGSHGLNI